MVDCLKAHSLQDRPEMAWHRDVPLVRDDGSKIRHVLSCAGAVMVEYRVCRLDRIERAVRQSVARKRDKEDSN